MHFNYVIVGGGSAGAILARRIADANIGTVALLEAGRTDENDPVVLDIFRLYEQSPDLDWGFRASTLDGGPAHLNYSRAKVLGGCGSHNDCAWVIPPDSDFATWRALGARGWDAEEVRFYFQRLEERVRVETRPPTHPVSAAFLRAGEELGLDRVAFREGAAQGVGMLSLNAAGRLRQSSSVAYLHPLSALPANLTILSETLATRILFADGEAVGCETTRGPVFARREVVLAAGSIGSPQLLMVSGIGDPAHLAEHGIATVAALPGVGQNLADHASAAVAFELREPVPPWDVTPYEVIMMLRIDPDAPAPDSLCHLGLTMGSPSGRHGENPHGPVATGGNLIDIAPNVARPRSRGEVRLASPDLQDAPIINLNYFSDPEGYDLRILRESLRVARRFLKAPAFRRMALRESAPGPDVVTDDALDHYIRTHCETVYHAAGTCRIGAADDPGAVLDPALRVRGVGHLRVCDASAFPTMVTVNINSTVMMLAERAANLIIADAREGSAASALDAGILAPA